MDSAALTVVLVISLATNAVVLGLFLAGRLGLVPRRASRPAATSMSRPPASLVPVMALPDADADRGERAWMERAEARITESRQVGQPATVVLIEVIPPLTLDSPVESATDEALLNSLASSLQATTQVDDLFLQDSATAFRVLLADADEIEAGALVDRWKLEFERAHPGAVLIAAWASPSDAGLDVALRLAEARLAGRREGWIRSVAVR